FEESRGFTHAASHFVRHFPLRERAPHPHLPSSLKTFKRPGSTRSNHSLCPLASEGELGEVASRCTVDCLHYL
ncbi:MAG: hypothetical protein ACE1ZE_07105, partial [Candidatus Binatia bacterium]